MQVTIYNKEAYVAGKGYSEKEETWDKFASELDEGETPLYIILYFGPLAASGYLIAVNEEAYITREEMQWLS